MLLIRRSRNVFNAIHNASNMHIGSAKHADTRRSEVRIGRTPRQLKSFSVFFACCFAIANSAYAAVQQQSYTSDRVSDITNTKHNFASGLEPTLPNSGTRTVKSTSQNEVCVFCHTPHFADTAAKSPLWNRKLSGQTYTLYSSNSMDATLGQPDGSSKMCLSCHDGTLAIGAVNIVNANSNADMNITITHTTGAGVGSAGTNADSVAVAASPGVNIVMDTAGLSGGALAAGTDGYTSNLGTSLANDHPIGFTYDSTLASNDGELYAPGTLASPDGGDLTDNYSKGVVGPRVAGTSAANSTDIRKPPVPLEGVTGDQVQCGTCHDPHIRSAQNDHNIKFLRLNRFQKAAASAAGSFAVDTDINCLACHKKHAWSTSAHADQSVATAQYNNTAAATREFPLGTQVWEASCLNCHDSHTETGAPKLLRSGSDGSGNAASENTCFQCHGTIAESVLASGQELADLRTLMGTSTADHGIIVDATETHDTLKNNMAIGNGTNTVGSGNLIETNTNLSTNRHAECQDCHHPHRAQQTKMFDPNDASRPAEWAAVTMTGQGTHVHENGVLHTNIASGALRGVWGVEPSYTGATAWGSVLPATAYTIMSGDPSDGTTSYVTKEYQVCLKCHSSFANGTGTDQALEFVPDNDAASYAGDPENHRSWHPVIGATGRTDGSANYASPWDTAGAAGVQTMYCSDCHTSNDSKIYGSGTGPQGPHGSINAAILKDSGDALCFNCHSQQQYAGQGLSFAAPGTLNNSGFSCTVTPGCVSTTAPRSLTAIGGTVASEYEKNLHAYHALNSVAPTVCTDCHVAVPHGWKDKALLANVGTDGQTEPAAGSYTNAPYFSAAKIQITNFPLSNDWAMASCGTANGCHQP